jgi:hypothetical protein
LVEEGGEADRSGIVRQRRVCVVGNVAEALCETFERVSQLVTIETGT